VRGGACRVGGDAGVESAVVHPGGGDVEVADDVAARRQERVEHQSRAAAQLGAVQQPRDVRVGRSRGGASQGHARPRLDCLRDERRVQLRGNSYKHQSKWQHKLSYLFRDNYLIKITITGAFRTTFILHYENVWKSYCGIYS
jgi:hypothetical protein